MTLLLSRADVERLLTPQACIAAVEEAFRELALGNVAAPGILGMHGFHLKTAKLGGHFAAKLNANFPGNRERGLPTIQGVVVLSSSQNGELLALMDSMSITALRTAAASAVAARHLAREDCKTLLVVGCGAQAPAQLAAMLAVRRPARVLAYDQDPAKTLQGATRVRDLRAAVAESDLIVTCTTAKQYFITQDMVKPGTFIAAVGADHEDKQEIDPLLMAAATVVTDLTSQAASIGDLHHAPQAQVHAELGEVVAGKKRGRARDEEIIVFDSTGTGLQDVAAAIATYRQALAAHAGMPFEFS
jgi:alanine dehydrogenase